MCVCVLWLPQVFDSVCELVQSALDGYHVCLFSYGQTGAGKTFTMSGGPTPEQQGIMPRAVQQVRALRSWRAAQMHLDGRASQSFVAWSASQSIADVVHRWRQGPLLMVVAASVLWARATLQAGADFVHCGLLLLLQILASVAQLTEQEWQYTLTASCIEVYNNQLR